MCKKVMLIAALAVAAAVVVIGGPRLVSHLRCMRQQGRAWFEQRIPPEQEIARLRMELNNLAREDGKAFEKVARQFVEIDRIEKKVEAQKAKLAKDENRIRVMKTSLTGESQLVSYNGLRVSRSELQRELRTTAERFQAEEATLQSQADELSAKKQTYELNRKKLSELKLVRQQMATELQRLETALVKERQAQAQENNTLDDASYRRIRKDMDAVRDRIAVMTKTSELKKEVNSPIFEAEKRREQEAKIDKYLDERFGDKAEGQ